MREREKSIYIGMSDEGEGSWTSEENLCAREKRPSECSEPVNGRKGHVRSASVIHSVCEEREGRRKNRDQTIWLDKFLRWPLFTLSTSFWVRVCDRWLRLSTLCACFANSDLFYFICCVLIAFDPLNWQKVKSLNRILNISTHTPQHHTERKRDTESRKRDSRLVHRLTVYLMCWKLVNIIISNALWIHAAERKVYCFNWRIVGLVSPLFLRDSWIFGARKWLPASINYFPLSFLMI